MIIGINATYLSSRQKTGIENYSSLLILALLRYDQSNFYRLFSSKNIEKKILPDTKNYALHVSPFPKGWHRFRLPLSLLRHKVDLFFDPGYTVPPFISIPTVVSIHDLAHKHFPEVYTLGQINNLERSFRLAERKAAGLIFSSRCTQDDFNKFYPASKALQTVIYMGFNDKNFEFKKEKDLLHLSEPYILYVGRLEKKKNIINLIRAYVAMRHKNPDLKHHLVLCGMAGYGFEEIEKEIKQNEKFGKDIIVTGYVSDRDLPHLYAKADLFVFPSLYEGFGIPLLEAFAAKVPVAASNASSIPEVAGDSVFYFSPDKVGEIASTLSTAINDNSARKKKINTGYKSLKRFSWKSYVQQFLEFIEQIEHENSLNS